jgi:hypothetical protein
VVRIISYKDFDEVVRNSKGLVFVIFSNGGGLCTRMMEQVAKVGINTCIMYTTNRDNKKIMEEFLFQRPPQTILFEDGKYKNEWTGFMQSHTIKAFFKLP